MRPGGAEAAGGRGGARAREALRVLTEDGLVSRLGDRVGLARAAVRLDALAPIRGVIRAWAGDHSAGDALSPLRAIASVA